MSAVHIWIIPAARASEFEPHLAVDEVALARSIPVDDDRARFIVGRGARRVVLARELGAADPRALRFVEGPHGKPSLDGHALEFNVSHAGSVVALAVARGRAVGIDVEEVRPIDALAVAGRMFSRAERDALEATADAGRLATFFAIWSRKESVVKALGAGLALALDAFDVEPDPARAPRVLGSRTPLLRAADVAMRDVPVPEGYAASLAVLGDRDEVEVVMRVFTK